jgi:hypothetical protein
MYLRSIICILISLPLGSACFGQAAKNKIDASKIAVVLPFESTLEKTRGFPEVTRTAVIAVLKDEKIFADVLTPETAKDKDKATLVEISAKLVQFAPGNMAARVLVGMGSGRSSASYDFTVKDSTTGNVLWQNRIKEKASVWSNSASSSAQRGELPDKIAETFAKLLKGKKK